MDQGYKSWLVEFVKQWFGITVDIVQRSPELREFVVQSQRWKIERTFGWLDWSRILSKEYERTTESSESNIISGFYSVNVAKVDVLAKVIIFIYTASIGCINKILHLLTFIAFHIVINRTNIYHVVAKNTYWDMGL